MISCKDFYELLTEKGIDFFTGVPDSLLKDFNAYIMDNSNNHIITANEGNAIAMATGYHLATGKTPLVYMQNSGHGNAINPLTSLADKDVYSIPMILLIGWRGEPGNQDEPQHIKQGKVTINILESLEIPYTIMPDSLENLTLNVSKLSSPYALVVKKGTFEPYTLKNKLETLYDSKREDAIKLIVNSLAEKDIIVSTTGKTSRELFEYREEKRQGHERDFLTVGSMGHSSSIAMSIALQKKERQVYCLDGDGALIMHMGSLAVIGQQRPKNFRHIVFNNGCHESVGGQPTAGFYIDIPAIAKACGYNLVMRAEKPEEIKEKLKLLKNSEGPALLEIRINNSSRSDLGRPTTTPKENKEKFMDFLKK